MRIVSEWTEELIQQSALAGIDNFRSATDEELFLIQEFTRRYINEVTRENPQYSNDFSAEFEIGFVQKEKEHQGLYIGFENIIYVRTKTQIEAAEAVAEELRSETGWSLRFHPFDTDAPSNGTYLLFGAAQTAETGRYLREEEDSAKVEKVFYTALKFALAEENSHIVAAETFFYFSLFYSEKNRWREALLCAEQLEKIVQSFFDTNEHCKLNPVDLILLAGRVGHCFSLLGLPERSTMFAERNKKNLEKIAAQQTGTRNFLPLFVMRDEDWKAAQERWWKQTAPVRQYTDNLLKKFCA